MYRFLILVISLIVMTVLVAGCNGARELDEVGNVIAMGLDIAEEGKIFVSYQLAIPQQEGGKADASKATVVITIKATTIAESLNLLNSQIEYVPSLSHIKVIVLGEELARQGIDKVVAPFMRYHEFRGSMFVMVAKGTAKEILEGNKPIFTASMAKYYEEVFGTADYSGYFLRTSLHQYYMRRKSYSGHPYMAFIAINPATGEGKINNKKVAGGKNDGYNAGDIPRQGGNPLEFAGVAAFSDDKMVGVLSTTETRMLGMLLGEYPHGFLSVEDPLDPRYFVNINLRLGSKPKIKIKLVDGRPVIDIGILLEGDISNIGSGINYENQGYIDLLERQIEKVYEEEMINLIRRTQELDSDVAGFGYYLRPVFLSNQEMQAYHWNEQYGQAEVNVKIRSEIRRTGLMLRTIATE